MTTTVPFLLSILIWLPIVGAVLVLATGSDDNARLAKTIAVITAGVQMFLSIPLYLGFDPTQYAMQFMENYSWIEMFNARYALGVDGLSLIMVILTNFTGLIVVFAGCYGIKSRVAQYMAAFLVLQGMLVGVFCAMDALLFYVFWEGMLIPMYLAIGIWGSSNRAYASIKFFLFTFLGSILMLLALIYLYQQTGSFMIEGFYNLPLSLNIQECLFVAFVLAFAVKVPMWPIHTWLPDAHTEAPAGGSVVLAAIMLKLGVYGLLRFTMPITPLASQELAWVMILLSLVAVVYIGLVAIVQVDMKKLIAYSSIAHMGFCTLGCFMIYDIMRVTQSVHVAYMSLEGAVVQMVAHAFSSGAMFLGVGMLSDRIYNHSRLIKDYGGVASTMPLFAAFFMLFAMSNVGLPGTAGFVGEFMVIVSAFKVMPWVAGLASLTLVLSAAYTLWMYKRVFFGSVVNAHVANFKDISHLEKLNYVLLAISVLWLGLYPQPIIDLVRATLGHLVLRSVSPELAANLPSQIFLA